MEKPFWWTNYFCIYAYDATDDSKKTEHLLALDGAKERLHLFQADLIEEGSFDTVVDGCEGVFHTASPVQFSATDPQVCPFTSCFKCSTFLIIVRCLQGFFHQVYVTRHSCIICKFDWREPYFVHLESLTIRKKKTLLH